jgi:hypothetical protein
MLLSHKRKNIMLFSGEWTELEIIMLSDNSSLKTQISHVLAHL